MFEIVDEYGILGYEQVFIQHSRMYEKKIKE